MDREPVPVTVAAPRPGGPPPDLLESAPTRSRRLRPLVAAALVAAALVAAAVVRDGAPAPARPTSGATTAPGITATASLSGAATDEPYAQRLTLTIDLPPSGGGEDGHGRSPDDCAGEPQAPRGIVLTVRTGAGPDRTVRAVSDPDVARALDRLVSRTCGRPRG